jgi:hypothetical protein
MVWTKNCQDLHSPKPAKIYGLETGSRMARVDPSHVAHRMPESHEETFILYNIKYG